MSDSARFLLLILCVLTIAGADPARFAAAQTAATPTDVQAQIDQHNAAIASLNAEIAAYQKQLDVLGGQKQTLTSAIQTIDVSRKQTATQAEVTQNKIGATDLQLTQIRGDIATKQQIIEIDKSTVAKAIRDLQASYHSNDHHAINASIEALNAATQKLAENMMNTAVSSALKGTTI